MKTVFLALVYLLQRIHSFTRIRSTNKRLDVAHILAGSLDNIHEKLLDLAGSSAVFTQRWQFQIFCFQIKRTPWMSQLFSDCVIRVRFFYLTVSLIFFFFSSNLE